MIAAGLAAVVVAAGLVWLVLHLGVVPALAWLVTGLLVLVASHGRCKSDAGSRLAWNAQVSGGARCPRQDEYPPANASVPRSMTGQRTPLRAD